MISLDYLPTYLISFLPSFLTLLLLYRIAGWFFGILIFLFGLILVVNALFGEDRYAGQRGLFGLFIMFIGALICYGGGRSGKRKKSGKQDWGKIGYADYLDKQRKNYWKNKYGY